MIKSHSLLYNVREKRIVSITIVTTKVTSLFMKEYKDNNNVMGNI